MGVLDHSSEAGYQLWRSNQPPPDGGSSASSHFRLWGLELSPKCCDWPDPVIRTPKLAANDLAFVQLASIRLLLRLYETAS
jgi:hypothetical protein